VQGGRNATGRWRTAASGIYLEIPDEPDAQRAARDLSNTMLVKYASLPTERVPESSRCSM